MTEPYSAVWAIDESDFPAGGDAGDVLRFAQRYAILAPSGHNGQPWRFRIDRNALEVRADRRRALPMVDPLDREMLISCAATVHITRTVLEHFGYRPEVTLLPDADDPDLLAVVLLGGRGDPPRGRELFDAIRARHCNRAPYRATAIPEETLARLADAAAAEGAWLVPITDRDAIAVAADLIALGDRIKWCDAEFRGELAERLVPNRGDRRDGMPGYAFGIPGPLARLAPGVVRRADLGWMRAAGDRKLALASPCLAVVGTDRDEPFAWMAAGQAMSAALLHATAAGLATSFLSQPVEVQALRPRLAALTDRDGHPQLLLRVGYARRSTRPSPRRPLADVLDAPPIAVPAAAAAAVPETGARS